MYTANFKNEVLFNPISKGANHLKIIAGYATHTMASWHLSEIETLYDHGIKITLIVGMCKFDGLSISVHEGFKSLMREALPKNSQFYCQYIFNAAPVHSKLFLWEKNGKPFSAFMGSANYTQTAFSPLRREIMTKCDPIEANDYFNIIESDSIYCTHAEIEDYITLCPSHPILNAEESPLVSVQGAGISSVNLSLLTKNGEVGNHSGLNWGQRYGREPNQAYIPLPAKIARTDFFPINRNHFSVLTDDGKQLILRVEQQNNKAITTPLNNSLLGEYFRNRLGLANGAHVSAADLKRYGRTNVTFYKLDDEQYFMDFSVQKQEENL